MADTIAGIPVEVLPPKVQAGLRTHLTLQMAVSADAIRSVFGGREEHVVRQLSARSGAQVQLWPVPADAIDRRVSMVGTIRELLEAHRLLHVALNGGEPERTVPSSQSMQNCLPSPCRTMFKTKATYIQDRGPLEGAGSVRTPRGS